MTLAPLEGKGEVAAVVAGAHRHGYIEPGLAERSRPNLLGFELGQGVVARPMDPQNVPLAGSVYAERGVLADPDRFDVGTV